ATTVAPIHNPISARRRKLLVIKCRTGEAGCSSKVVIAHVENIYKANSPASIRYSGQWRRELLNLFTASALIVPLIGLVLTGLLARIRVSRQPRHVLWARGQTTFPSPHSSSGGRTQRLSRACMAPLPGLLPEH